MKRHLIGCAIVLATSALGGLGAENKVTSVDWKEIGYGVKITGKLGMPIGTFVEIEGRREDLEGMAMKGAVHTTLFRVEKVNGKSIEKPVSIAVRGVDLPPSTPCVLQGYETGEMVGVPPGVPHPSQVRWRFEIVFDVLKMTGRGS